MRIYNLDKDKERGTNFLGIYYANNKMYSEAKSIYKKYMEEEKPSEIIFSLWDCSRKRREASRITKIFLESIRNKSKYAKSSNKVLEFSKAKSDEEYYKNLYKISTLPVSWEQS